MSTERDGSTVFRAPAGLPLVVLEPELAARTRPNQTTGLYHFALLVPSRRDLAAILRRLSASRWPAQGAADHLVSEALYLADPDGNGIEIYRDRDRAEWPIRGGEIEMGTLPLDTVALLTELADEDPPSKGLPQHTRVGHVHLQVSDLRRSEHFYCETLGLRRMQRYGESAVFLAAGGYHHHVGLNTWSSKGASQPPPDAVGLTQVTFGVPAVGASELERRLKNAKLPFESSGHELTVADPDGINLRFAFSTPAGA